MKFSSLSALVLLMAAGCSNSALPPTPPPLLGPIPIAPVALPEPEPEASAEPAAEPPPPSPPTPINGALPDKAPVSLSLRAECAKGTCARVRLLPDEVREALTGPGTSFMWEEAIGDKAVVSFPADLGIDLAGVVLDGSVEIRPKEKGAAKLSLEKRYQGFHAPGAGLSIAAAGGKPARVLVVMATNPPEVSLAAHMARFGEAKNALVWSRRAKPIAKVDYNALEDLAWGGGAYHARIGWDPSGEGESIGVNMIRFSATASVKEHVHDKEQECIAALEGEGDLVLRVGGKEERKAITAGSVVCVPKGEAHAWQPSGKEPFLAIQSYTPPGPEQRFKKLAGK